MESVPLPIILSNRLLWVLEKTIDFCIYDYIRLHSLEFLLVLIICQLIPWVYYIRSTNHDILSPSPNNYHTFLLLFLTLPSTIRTSRAMLNRSGNQCQLHGHPPRAFRQALYIEVTHCT